MLTKIIYEIEAEQDDIPVRGNAMVSGDERLDKEVEDSIIARLNHGDYWAWAVVKVTAKIRNCDLEGVAYLGCCTYEDEADFEKCEYYEDMCFDARRDLVNQLKRACFKYEELPEYVKGNYPSEEAMKEARAARAEYEQIEQEASGEIYQDMNCFE